MGKLIEGQWLTDSALVEAEAVQYKKAKGQFERGTAQFRNWITADGSPGPSGKGGFKAETDRYHLFAAINCPWAHRTLIYRQVKQLENLVSLSIVTPKRTENGWIFDQTQERFKDTLYDLSAIYELYIKDDPTYTGRATVPILWDKKTQTIVSTESSEIIRMFNRAFNHLTGDTQDFYPESLGPSIDELNDYIYTHINNGTYKAGFARTQEAYNEAVTSLFDALDNIEARLSQQPYLLGNAITEADWRLLPTLARFDVGYYSAFKCNLKAIRDYPYLSAYFKNLYQQPGIAETIDFDIYRQGYHSKSALRNPQGIIPLGPDLTVA